MKALRIAKAGDGIRADLSDMNESELTDGNVLIKVRYSSLNFKDALAITGRGKIVSRPPLNAGIDAAGIVESSEDARFNPGDEVVATGWFLGESRDGGLAEYVRVPGECLVARPEGLTLWQAMALGTAGFTVGMAIKRMHDNGQRPGQGAVLVTGATGGVGMFAIDMLAGAGYEVVAVSRKADMHGDFLSELGAIEVITPNALDTDGRPLGKTVYAGGIDTVGDGLLADLLAHVRPYGNVAAIGLAGGAALSTTVLPFILRGVSLLGIHSVECPQAWREQIWSALAGEHKPRYLDSIATQTVGLRDVYDVCDAMMAGRSTGRTVVDIEA